jgi:molybdate transport system regulatory protein
MRVRSKVWLEKDGRLCFGAGKAGILRAVEETGSLSEAARKLEMSYRHAWTSIRAAEERLGRPLLVRRRGGKEKGGASLTGYAKELLRRFEKVDRDVRAFAARRYRETFARKRARRKRS